MRRSHDGPPSSDRVDPARGAGRDAGHRTRGTKRRGRGSRGAAGRALDRRIFALAVPALGALIAEPLFLLTDTALVGHLGDDVLAGLGIASAILGTALGLLIFLAYTTTPAVAKALGEGNRAGAVTAGITGMWLAVFVGIPLSAVGLLAAPALVAAFGPTAAVAEQAELYLTVSIWGIPAMLLVIAATGMMRGLQDTRTTLYVAVAGFAANAALNAVLIYGLGAGIGGSALGTVIAQYGMAAVYCLIAWRAARGDGVTLRPNLRDVTVAAGLGGWMFLRTLSLRIALLATVVVATGLGTAPLAAYQIVASVFTLLAFVLDSFAIAAQALIGKARGEGTRGDADRDPEGPARHPGSASHSGDPARALRDITARIVFWSVATGLVLTVPFAAISPVLGGVFSGDAGVLALLPPLFLVLAASAPLAGFVFALDGVLIGQGRARYLGVTGMINLACYLPVLWWVGSAFGGSSTDPAAGIVWLWVAYAFGYLGARALTLAWGAFGPGPWGAQGSSRP